jgi:hypothetical protein
MKNPVKICFVVCILLGCGSKNEKGVAVYHVTKWEGGNIKTEGYYVNDTIKEGLV